MKKTNKGEKVKKVLAAFIILFLTSGILGCQKKEDSINTKKQSEDNSLNVETDKSSVFASDFTLKLTNGKDIKLSDHKGKIVIVDFWATWCPPCRRGIPDLVDIQKEYKNDVVIIGISLDTQTKPDVVPFIKEFGINYPVAYATMEVVQNYGNIESIPTSFIIDQSGKIVDMHIGLVEKSVYVDKITELLKKS